MIRAKDFIAPFLFLLSGSAVAADLSVFSNTVKPGEMMTTEQVFNGFGCTGKNVSPDLSWSGAPEGTKAFAVTMYDPDAPTGSGWWHWLLFNIPAHVTKLTDGAGSKGGKLPKGAIQSQTDFGKPGYGGPCPPAGDKPHRYIIKVIALKDKIPLKKNAPGAMVGFYVNQLKLAEGTIEGKFAR